MTIIELKVFQEKKKIQEELKEWQKRLQLAYEFDWKDPSKIICHEEVERLRKILDKEIGKE